MGLLVLANLEEVDGEIFIDIFLTEKELLTLTHYELLTTEKQINGRTVHIGICAPDEGEFNGDEEREEKD